MSIPFHKHLGIDLSSDGGWDTHVKANVSKCTVVVFSKSKPPGSWTWGEHTILSDGGWDTHVKSAISMEGRKLISFTVLLVIGILI